MYNDIAIMIPTYTDHFWRAKNFLRSFHKFNYEQQADLWFIFTSEEESEKFGDYKNKLILPADLRIFDNNGIINIKKFYGLTQLKDSYKYVIVLDSESVLIKKTNLLKVCEKFYSDKKLYGNTTIYEEGKSEKLQKMKEYCASFFENKHILKQYDDLYLWFNVLCIYKTELLDDFFQKTNLLVRIKELRFYDFDFYIFMYYLILYHNFIVVDLHVFALVGFLESYAFIPKYGYTTYKEFPPPPLQSQHIQLN